MPALQQILPALLNRELVIASCALVGAWLLFRGWRGSRADVRRRRRGIEWCRGCRYEMNGAPELRCPECGREHSDRGELTGPQRQGELAFLGVVLIAFGLLVLPGLYRSSAGRTMRLPFVPSAWLIAKLPWLEPTELVELRMRQESGDMWWVQQAVLQARARWMLSGASRSDIVVRGMEFGQVVLDEQPKFQPVVLESIVADLLDEPDETDEARRELRDVTHLGPHGFTTYFSGDTYPLYDDFTVAEAAAVADRSLAGLARRLDDPSMAIARLAARCLTLCDQRADEALSALLRKGRTDASWAALAGQCRPGATIPRSAEVLSWLDDGTQQSREAVVAYFDAMADRQRALRETLPPGLWLDRRVLERLEEEVGYQGGYWPSVRWPIDFEVLEQLAEPEGH